MKGKGWKFLGPIILIYVFIGGMTVPLKTGIVGVNPSTGRTGSAITLDVIGYNSNFLSGKESLRAWLKLDEEKAILAKKIDVQSERQLKITFDIPAYLPVADRVKDFALILDNEIDGASVLPSALFITQDSIDPEMGLKNWENGPIDQLHTTSGITFPFRNILSETIRNTYFHVPLWFSMLFLFVSGIFNGIRYLRTNNLEYDIKSQSATQIGVIMGLLGLVTGAIWAGNTWGAYWSWDVKQNMTAVALLIYLAYFVLRSSFEDPEQKARLSAVYGIFAFATLIPLIYVIPRLTDSLHPGAGGNPAFGGEDLDNTMRLFFYPAIIGWTLLGFWMAELVYRAHRLRYQLLTQ